MTSPEVTIRTSADVILDIIANQTNPAALRALSVELLASQKHEEQAEANARNEAIRAAVNPLKDYFSKRVETSDGLTDFIRAQGGTLTYVYQMAPEGSENGPVVSLTISSKAAPKPAAAGTTSSANGSANRGGKMTDQFGQPLAALFDLVASDEDRVELAKRMDSAGTDKSKNSAAWAVKTRVVQKAIEAGDARLPAKVG